MDHRDEERRVLDLVRKLATAWKQLLAYPPGHPAVRGTVEMVRAELVEFIDHTASRALVFGVARDALLIRPGEAGEETRIESPHAERLAAALYEQHVAVVRVGPEMTTGSLETLLRLLKRTPADEDEVPLWERLERAGAHGIALEPIDYSGVEMGEEDEDEVDRRRDPQTLTEAIVQGLMRGGELQATGEVLDPTGEQAERELASFFSEWIERRSGESGERSASAVENRSLPPSVPTSTSDYLRGRRRRERRAALREALGLMRALPPSARHELLDAVVGVLAADPTAADDLVALSRVVPAPALAAALSRQRSGGVEMTVEALQLLARLRRQVGGDEERRRAGLFPSLDAFRRFVESEDVDRLVPGAGERPGAGVLLDLPPLEEVPQGDRPELGARLRSLTDEMLTRSLTTALLELVERGETGERLEAVLDRLVAAYEQSLDAGWLRQAMSVATTLRRLADDDSQPPRRRRAITEAVHRLSGERAMSSLAEALVELETERAARLVRTLGDRAVPPLLEALSEEEDRSHRRRLLTLLSELGDMVAVPARRRLDDERWYVVRNMLYLLRQIEDRESSGSVRRLARHPDLRVRLEAIKSLFAFEAGLSQELLDAAILDRDPRVAEAAIALAVTYEIEQAAEPLVRMLRRWDPFRRRESVRIKALEALGELGVAEVLPRLERYFKDWFFPVVSRAERRAAFASLKGYGPESRRPYLAQGLRSTDARIREISERLAGRPDRMGEAGRTDEVTGA